MKKIIISAGIAATALAGAIAVSFHTIGAIFRKNGNPNID